MLLLLAAQNISLVPDRTVLWQFFIFLFVLTVLTIFVFRPVLKILERRKEETTELRRDAERLETETAKLIKEYDGRIAKARSEGVVAEQRLIKEGETAARVMTTEARSDAREVITRAREKIRYERERTNEELTKRIDEYSELIISKVLDKSADNK